ncbi:MAG: hypothetical protein RLZZ627_1267, partial [Pseudomonadota bacterium]
MSPLLLTVSPYCRLSIFNNRICRNMQRMTKNRALVLQILRECFPPDYIPPYSARDTRLILSEAFGINQSIGQVHRTISDLHKAGLLHVSERMEPGVCGSLPQRVKCYEHRDDIEKNSIERRIEAVCREA